MYEKPKWQFIDGAVKREKGEVCGGLPWEEKRTRNMQSQLLKGTCCMCTETCAAIQWIHRAYVVIYSPRPLDWLSMSLNTDYTCTAVWPLGWLGRVGNTNTSLCFEISSQQQAISTYYFFKPTTQELSILSCLWLKPVHFNS